MDRNTKMPLDFQVKLLVLLQLSSGISQADLWGQQRYLMSLCPEGSMACFFHHAIMLELENLLSL